MNQIKKRLEIIKIAISMTDSETIRLQLLKLEPFEIDPKLDEIIDLLKIKNYAQAQYLISEYINPTKIIEEESENKKEDSREITREKTYTQKKHSIIEEFQIIMPSSKDEDEDEDDKDIEENPYQDITPAHKVLLEAMEDEENEQYLEPNIEEDIEIDEEEIPQEYDENEVPQKENNKYDVEYEEYEEITEDEETSENEELQEEDVEEKYDPAPIKDIEERFEQIYGVYDFYHQTDTRYQSTKIWITQIKNRGVNNSSLQAMLQHIENLKGRDDTSEAAQLICVCAATNLQLGRLLLARELYRGKLASQDEVEAYKIIHELAQEEYDEALCDLGQFYEFGVAVSKNEKKAKELYEKAIALGLQRAKSHLERINKKSGIFSKVLQ
ncbi:MAG: SEL1-like repeat protein [Campylobacterales bacterium]|nr:SEL1-like repeat protein [Campylobacterales bacterium]